MSEHATRTAPKDWQGVLQRRPPVQATQILRRLRVGRLVFTPKETEDGMVYEFSGAGPYGCSRAQ